MPESVSKRQGRPRAGDFCDPNTGEINDTGKKLIQTAAGMGLPLNEIAALIGMSGKAFYDRRKMFPEIDVLIQEGEADSGFRVANALMKKCVGGDMAAIRWFEMTRKGRAEKSESKVEETTYVIEVPATLEAGDWESTFSPASPKVEPDGDDTPI